MTLETAITALTGASLPTLVGGAIIWLLKNSFIGMRSSFNNLADEVKESNARLSSHDTKIETLMIRIASIEKEQERQAVRMHEISTSVMLERAKK